MERVRARGRLLLVGVVLLSVGVPAGGPAEPGRRAALVRALRGLGVDDRLVVDAAHRRVVAIKRAASRLLLYDPDRWLRPGDDGLVQVLDLAPLRFPAFPPTVYAWDEARSVLYLHVVPGALGPLTPDVLGVNAGKVADDAASSSLLPVRVTAARLVPGAAVPIDAFPPGFRIAGMTFVAEHGPGGEARETIYAVADPLGLSVGAYAPLLAAFDARTGRAAWPAPVHVRPCQRIVRGVSQAGVAVARDPAGALTVFVGCGEGHVVVPPQPGGVPAVVAVDATDPARPSLTFYPIAGSYGGGDTLFDPAAGRFLMVSAGTSAVTQSAWVFDQDRRVFLGNQSGDAIVGVGLDRSRGILYLSGAARLQVGSVRGLELGQLRTFDIPEVGPLGTTGEITPIGFNGTLVVPGRETGGEARAPALLLYRDPVRAVGVAPGTEDLLALANVGGQVLFGGGAQAFGMRIHQIGGGNATLQNVFPRPGENYWYGPPQRISLGRPGGIDDGDRTLYFGRVAESRLNQDTAVATAVARHADDGITDDDFETLTKNLEPLGQERRGFSSEITRCADLGAGAESAGGEDAGAGVACDRTAATVDAEAQDALLSAGPLLVGWAGSATRVFRDPDEGLVAVAEAEADHVILGDVFVGRIASTVRVSAGGAPGAAKISFERTFENVSAPGYTCAAACDPAQVVSAINEALRGLKLRAEIPQAEAVSDDRGERAMVQRDPFEHRQDVGLNNLSQKGHEVPALRIISVNDNFERVRTIIDFAAAKADVGFFPPTGAPQVPEPPLPEVGSLRDLAPVGPAAPEAAFVPVPTEPQTLTRVVRTPGRGWRWFLGGSPRTVLLAASLWAMFAAPALLVLRRRHLARLLRRTM